MRRRDHRACGSRTEREQAPRRLARSKRSDPGWPFAGDIQRAFRAADHRKLTTSALALEPSVKTGGGLYDHFPLGNALSRTDRHGRLQARRRGAEGCLFAAANQASSTAASGRGTDLSSASQD